MSWIGRIRATFKRRSNPSYIVEDEDDSSESVESPPDERWVLENIDFREKYQSEKMKRIYLEERSFDVERLREEHKKETDDLLKKLDKSEEAVKSLNEQGSCVKDYLRTIEKDLLKAESSAWSYKGKYRRATKMLSDADRDGLLTALKAVMKEIHYYCEVSPDTHGDRVIASETYEAARAAIDKAEKRSKA
jgi:hypothetical protein